MSFSMMTIQPSISQDAKDNEEWERKKKKQQSQMALANARTNSPGAPASGAGALGVSGIAAANRTQPAVQPKYPTPSDLPKYDSIAAANAGQKQAMSNLTAKGTGFGMGYSVPSASQPRRANGGDMPATAAPAGTTDKKVDDAANPLYNTTTDAISATPGNKSYGLSITPSSSVAPSPTASFAESLQGFGANVANKAPQPIRRSSAEEAERAALLRQATTVQKGANGITAAQMGVQQSLQAGSDKINSDIYQAQLGAQNSIEQAQIREQGANSRAVLGELSAEQRQAQQLGFDADKFQQSAALDSRRLDLQQTSDDIKNRPQKDLNSLYDNLKAAETDEDKSAITAQINALKGVSAKDREDWVAIDGGQTIEGGLPVDAPPMLLNKRTGETRPIGEQSGPIAMDMNNPEIAAIMNDTKTNYQEKMAALDALGVITQ